MSHYPLTPAMAAFVTRTESFVSDDSSLAGLRQAYDAMCRALRLNGPQGWRSSTSS
jgi:acetyl esterase